MRIENPECEAIGRLISQVCYPVKEWNFQYLDFNLELSVGTVMSLYTCNSGTLQPDQWHVVEQSVCISMAQDALNLSSFELCPESLPCQICSDG